MHISHIHLHCRDLEAQRTFYGAVLGFPVQDHSVDSILVKVGTSILQFSQRNHAAPVHFALNIPSNLILPASKWLGARTDLIVADGQSIHHFEHWDAEAVYFHDPNGNIVEFIARKRLGVNGRAPFSVAQILSVSEIGLGAEDIQPIYDQLLEAGVPVHSGGPERFCSMGTPSGLFILVNTQLKPTWFPTGERIQSCEWTVQIELKEKTLGFAWRNDTLQPIFQP